jgi:hypothetical protein
MSRIFDSPSEQSEAPLAALLNELNQLAPWQALGAKRRGASRFKPTRTTSTGGAYSMVLHEDAAWWVVTATASVRSRA